ncbi:MAG TPA: hypothetical protein VLV83_04180 [Acidobacteriota bacterium]|nr:hypothetical protein [Acidobacteriota bacterium]
MRSKNVLLAGLAAGLVFNVAGMTSAVLIGLGESFARAGISPQVGGAVIHLGLRFGLGLAAAYLYALACGRLGSGLGAAGRLAVPVWMIGYLPPVVLLHEIKFLTQNQAILSALWGLLEAGAAIGVAIFVYNWMSRAKAR